MLLCKLTAETMSDEKHHTKECSLTKLSLARSAHKELRLFYKHLKNTIMYQEFFL